MSLIKKILILLLLITGVGGYYYYGKLQKNEGFSLGAITSRLPESYHYPTPPVSEEEKQLLASILSQPFTYIDKGCQFYVFESQDHKHVLKFFKHKHLKTVHWGEKRRLEKNKKIASLLTSCHIAYEKIPALTGVLFAHLNRQPFFNKEVVLIDRLGKKHSLFIDNYEFIVQKRGVCLKKLLPLPAQELEQKLEAARELIVQRIEKGVGDRDSAFAQNVAFDAEGKALYIDVGQLFLLEKPLTALEKKEEVEKRLAELR